MKTIYLVGGYNIANQGDRSLQYSMTQMLRKGYYSLTNERDLDLVYVDTQAVHWFPQLIEQMNREADLLLLGGGGFIFSAPQPNQSDWRFDMRAEDMRKIKIPVAAYGLGVNLFPFNASGLSNKAIDNLQTFIDLCYRFSLRNKGSLRSLNFYGLDVDSVSVVPDAAMFIKSSSYKNPVLDYNGLKIGVNWATDRPEQRYKTLAEYYYQMEKFFVGLNRVAKKLDARVYLIDHLLMEQRNEKSKKHLHSLVKTIMGNRAYIMYEEAAELFPAQCFTAGMFCDIYKQMDLVVGMRGHANILPASQKTPSIGLGHHNKVKWFLEEIGREDHHIYEADDIESQIERSANNLDVEKTQVTAALKAARNIGEAEIKKLLDPIL